MKLIAFDVDMPRWLWSGLDQLLRSQLVVAALSSPGLAWPAPALLNQAPGGTA
ncbi:hypothetical protein Q2941_12235 [Bradyrhizobium sp. UFLA05-153]